MIYDKAPEDFNPRFEVAGAFVECDGEIVLLHRQNHKPQGGTWGIPSGKIDQGESPLSTICREIGEETGLMIPETELRFFSTVYVKHWEYDLVYHMFHVKLAEKPVIKISEGEHKDVMWALPEVALDLPLIHDLDSCIKLFFGLK